MPSFYEVDEALRRVCLEWATASSAKKRHDVEERGRGRDAVAAGESFGAVPCPSVVSTVHAARAKPAIHPFRRELP